MTEATMRRPRFDHANPILNVADMARSLRHYPWAREMKAGDPDGHVPRFGSAPKESPL